MFSQQIFNVKIQYLSAEPLKNTEKCCNHNYSDQYFIELALAAVLNVLWEPVALSRFAPGSSY